MTATPFVHSGELVESVETDGEPKTREPIVPGLFLAVDTVFADGNGLGRILDDEAR